MCFEWNKMHKRKVYNMITRINGGKTFIKHFSCNSNDKFNSAKCNSNEKLE